MDTFSRELDAQGREWVTIPLRGRALLSHNLYNRGTAFRHEEREALQLTGLLPAKVTTLEEQSRRMYGSITRKTDPLERFIGLDALESRNAVLFYRILVDHIEEFLPVIYTPTVGLVCQQYSHIFRRGRGIWLTPRDRGRIHHVLANAPYDDVRLVVATDNEAILGLGDLGAGGMGIPVGKLALYTVAAGFHPSQCLPISLDLGTDNPDLLNDPLYVGWPHKRLRGQEYWALLDEFVDALRAIFPRAVLQWEDFRKGNAYALLDRYREAIPSFNDDVQGTSSVGVAGILAACRATGTPLREQRVLLYGAGAAGVGIARLLRERLRGEGVEGKALLQAIAVLDSQGLLLQSREIRDEYKREFAWPEELARDVGLSNPADANLLECVKALRPTVLIGTSGQAGSFTKPVVEAMLAATARPVIFPFSNPNSKAEAKPADLLAWSNGRAIVAAGSPFPPVPVDGQLRSISQGNNAYIFPGVGLGASVVGAKSVTDAMFQQAAACLAGLVEASDLAAGVLYPPLAQLRRVSMEVAVAVALEAVRSGLANQGHEEDIRAEVRRAMWDPQYPEIKLG